MKIYVIRHGLTSSNKRNVINGQAVDEPLEPEGMTQVEKAISNIPSNIKKIYSSNMLRTRQTAEILNKSLQLEISYHPELREVDFGELSQKSWEENNKKHGGDIRSTYINQEYDFRAFKGESFEDVKNRVMKILNEIKKEHPSGNVLIVAHGGIVRLMHHLFTDKHLHSTENASVYEFEI